MSALGRITRGSHIAYYSLMFFIEYAFKGHVHVFAGRVKIVRKSAIFKYICPLLIKTALVKENWRQVGLR